MYLDFGELNSLEYDQMLEEFCVENIPISDPVTITGFMVKTTELSIISRSNGGATLEEAHVPDGYWGLELPWNCALTQHEFYRHQNYGRHSFLVRPDSKTQWYIPAEAKLYCCIVSTKELSQQLTNDEMEVFYNQSREFCRSDVNQKEVSAFSKKLNDICRSMKIHSSTLDMSDFDWAIGEVFRQLLLACTPSVSGKSNISKSRVLLSSRDFIYYNYANKISVSDIASYSNTTVRTLQNIYLEFYGISPMRYLKNYRLYRFYNNLKGGLNKTQSAYLSGLTHLGRLTKEFESIYNFPK